MPPALRGGGVSVQYLDNSLIKQLLTTFQGVPPWEGLVLLLHHGPPVLPSKARANLRPLLLPSGTLGQEHSRFQVINGDIKQNKTEMALPSW